MTWQQIDEKLQTVLPSDIYSLWIKPLECTKYNDDTIELSGPDRFYCAWVADNYLPEIKRTMTELGMPDLNVVLTVGSGISSNKTNCLPAATKATEQLMLPSIPKPPAFVRTLNPRYVFDEFVVGDSNDVAFSACQAVAHGDTSLGRCIYVNSATGLGKSHLAHSVAHHLLAHRPGTRLNYLTAQQMTSEMVKSIKTKSMDSFKEKLANCDIMLMEDMQTLTGRVKTQEELSNLFDILLESGKSVLFTGATPPRDIKDLSPGISSRLSSGLITTISEPDLDTRFKIISKKAQNLNLQLSDELTHFLAGQVKGDIRQIRSALVGIKAKTKLRNMPATIDMVKQVLSNIIVQSQTVTPETIRDFIATQYKVSVDQLQSKSRKKTITFPRQISMYFSRKYTEKALNEIGQAFKRDHSTVVHSIKVISESINRNASIRGQVEMLDKKIKSQLLR